MPYIRPQGKFDGFGLGKQQGEYLKKPRSHWEKTSHWHLTSQERDPILFPANVYPHSPLLELVWLGHSWVSLPKTDEVSLVWVMEDTGHSPWRSLFHNVSNLQVLECLSLTLSGSWSYFRVNKSCLRHHTEQIQFVFMKNSPWKTVSIVYWLRLSSEQDSLASTS